MNHVDRIVKALSYQFFPAQCVRCQNPGLPNLDICVDCKAGLPAAPKPKSAPHGRVYAGFASAEPVDAMIQGFKFNDQLHLGRLLARLALPVFADETPSALIPIPLHRKRLRQRGFNQAAELAKFRSRQYSIPVLPNALQRIRATAVQSTLPGNERLANVAGAFAAKGILPAHVALVDDVYTTGATCQAAAEALLQYGVKRVDVWCLARVL